MAYQPINLGEIYANIDHSNAMAQQSKLAGLQIQQAQKSITDQNNVDAVVANPNAVHADYAKLGLAGLEAESKSQTLGANLDAAQARKAYISAADILVAPDPLAAVKRDHPNFIADYEKTHGPGTFPQDPNQVRQLAGALRDHAQNVLLDPKTQFEAAQKEKLAVYGQEGPGGEAQRKLAEITAANSRNAATIGAENQRAALGRGVQMRGQDITARGQDLTASRANIPTGYEPDPEKPGALRPIAGGPHDPNQSTGLGGRDSVMFNRVASSANSAVAAIKNIAELPITTSTGWFGTSQAGTSLFGSVKAVLGQKITGQEAQDLKTMIAGVSRNLATIESAGLAPNGSLTHSMDSVTINEGDTQVTKLRKMAEMRQIVSEGIRPRLSDPKVPAEQKQLIKGIIDEVEKAVPFTQHDITQLQRSKNPNATIMDYAKQQGLVPEHIQSLLDKYK